jgi:chromosome segregation ATPase
MSIEDEYRIDELTTQVEDLQDEIQSMEADIMLLKMEVVQRGDYIQRLESQNQFLKKQLMAKVASDVKVAAILKPKDQS